MYCGNCGTKNEEGAKFCENCGAKLEDTLEQQPAPATEEMQESVPETKKGKKGKKKWWILSAILLLLIAILLAVIPAVKKVKDKKAYEGYIASGQRYLEELDYEKAEECYLKAIKIDPKQLDPYVELADIYIAQEEYEKAKDILNQAKDNGAVSDKKEDESKPTIEDKLEEIENLEKIIWVAEPTIEADDIYYVAENNYFKYSGNGLAQQFMSRYAVIKKGDLFGLVDLEGRVKADFEYKNIQIFTDYGYMLIRKNPVYSEEFQMEIETFFLDENGNIAGKPPFGVEMPEGQFYWYDGLHFVREDDSSIASKIFTPQEAFPIKKSEKILHVDEQEKWYDLPAPFAVCKNQKLVTDFEYDECGASSEGLLAVCKNGKWGYINESGEIVIPIEYDASWPTSEQSVENKSYYFEGKDYCYAASSGYITLRKEDKWELRDTKGKLVIAPGIFEKICPVYNGKCWVKKDGKWGVIQVAEGAKVVSVNFDHNTSDPVKESAIVTGLDDAGNVVWTYETGKYDQAQLSRISDVGMNGEGYYLVEGESVVALNLADGSVLWKNSDFGGAAARSVFGADGTIYLCGYFGPDFFAVDKDGKTLKKIESFSNDYIWADGITYEGDKVIVSLHKSGTDEVVKIAVNLKDYTYSLPEQKKLSEKGKKDLSLDEICEVVAAHYNEINNTNTFVVFSNECMERDNGYVLMLRSQGGNTANVLVTGVTVNTKTGEAKDDEGHTFSIYE